MKPVVQSVKHTMRGYPALVRNSIARQRDELIKRGLLIEMKLNLNGLGLGKVQGLMINDFGAGFGFKYILRNQQANRPGNRCSSDTIRLSVNPTL